MNDGTRARLPWILAGVLAVTTLAASTGWFLAARDGAGIPPSCYSLDERGTGIRFDELHGTGTLRATFAVAESDDQVMLGYWEKSDGGTHNMRGYGGSFSYELVNPLGDRKVVDPAGDSVPRC